MNDQSLVGRMIQVCVRPEDVKKVRGLILSLAIRGKLTSKGVRSGDISGTFVIPSDWKWCTLSEIAACRGSAKAGSDGIKPSDWILDMEDIDGATGTVHTRATFKERSSLSTKSAFKQGDVLYGKLRPYLNKVVLADSPGFCTTEIIPITPGATIESRYLKLVLRSPYFLTYVAKRSYGMKMPRLGTKDLESARIPRPPLAEQKRIVAKVDELMALCDRLEAQFKERDVKQAALAKAALAKFTEDPTPENLQLLFHPSFTIEPDDLRKSILNLAVQGKLVHQDPNDEPADKPCEPDEELDAAYPFEVSHGWTWTRLAKLAEINGGFAFKSTAYTEEGIRVVRISDFDEFGFKDHKVVRHQFSNDLQRFTLEKQNILMAMTGGTVGKSYFVRNLPEPMVVNQRVATIKVYDSSFPSYIDIVIRSEMTQAVIRNAKNSTNDNISMGDIKGLRIPVPPLAEQRRIVEKVDQLMALVGALETQLEASRTTSEKLLGALVAELTAD